MDLPPFSPGPVVSVEIFNRDVVVHRRGRRHPGCVGIETGRGKITMLSQKSRQRLAFIANNTDVTFRTMITLTYPRFFPGDGRDVKQHLNTFLTWCRRHFSKPSYLWFLEFQRRGAPHIHMLLDYSLPRATLSRLDVYRRVAKSWYLIVRSRDERHMRAGTRVERIRKADGAKRYALKYAYKTKQKSVPGPYQNVGRFWGCSRDVRPRVGVTVAMDEMSVRQLLEDWEYKPAPGRMLYQTLFGCADRFRNSAAITKYADLTF